MTRFCLSIYIPFLAVLHIGVGKGLRWSLCCSAGWLAHYGRKQRSLGRSEKNIMGVWGHFDPRGRCVGYSRRGFLRIRHFDEKEAPTGWTCDLGILLLHFVNS